MDIKILGAGCEKCELLQENINQALKQLGKTANIELIDDIIEIKVYGVNQTPTLVIDYIVKVIGRVPSVEEIKKLIS